MPAIPEIATSEARVACGLEHKYLLSNDKKAPLFLLAHGRAGNFDVMWTFKRCIPEGSSILAVQAPLHDKIGGWSWWDIDDTKAIMGAPLGAEMIQRFLEKALEYYNLKPKAMVALGFSQGAGVLSCVLQKRPLLFTGVALLAGFVVPLNLGEFELREAESASSIFIAHGSQDPTVPITRAREGEVYLRRIGFSVNFIEDNVTHKVGATGMRALKEWCYSI